MQLEQIGRKDIIEQVGKVDGKATTTDAAQSEQKIAKGKLRSISVNNPFYNKNDLKEKTMAEKMEEQLAQGTDASLCPDDFGQGLRKNAGGGIFSYAYGSTHHCDRDRSY